MNGIPDTMGYALWAPPITAYLRRIVRQAARWHVPVVLLAAAACLIAGVSLPMLVVREFLIYGQRLSILDGVTALLNQGDWPLAAILVLFSIALPLVKIGTLLLLWWQQQHGRLPRGWLIRSLEWSGRWAMLDVLVVALAIVAMQAHAFTDAYVAEAVYPFVAAIGLIAYGARAVSRAPSATEP
jgi:paraquat-inducible protein A